MKRGLWAIVLVCGLARVAQAQVTVDAFANSGSQGSASFSFNHTVTGSNTELLVACGLHGVITVSAITFNGVALSPIKTQTQVSAPFDLEVWALTAPAAGTHAIAVTLSGTNSSVCISGSFTTVDQTTPFGTSVSDAETGTFGTTHTHSTTSQTNGLVWDAFMIGNAQTPAANGGQTVQSGPTDSSDAAVVVTTAPGATTVTTGYSWAAGDYWAHVTTPINPAAAIAAPPLRTLLGVGR